jgi:peptidoglycan/xylan/chitin deacetylase (PgdA/CDA1 family)
VLPLGEAVRRLYDGTLPPRSAAITFDDGFYGLYRMARPILREFRFPYTVYLTTYYCEKQWPVFDTMCSYLLWKSSAETFSWPRVLGAGSQVLRGRHVKVTWEVREYAKRAGLSGYEKNELLKEMAGRLGFDFDAISGRRIQHLINPEEATSLLSEGVDLQLHTHRHRVFQDAGLFQREIHDNRRLLKHYGCGPTEHFCYPGGFLLPGFPGWLRECGVRFATTCEPGLASPAGDPLLMPRLVVTSGMSGTEFEAWLTGLAAFMPRRATSTDAGVLLEEAGEEIAAVAAAGGM